MGGLMNFSNDFNGLQSGRIVNFVTKGGYIRPLLVLVAWQGTNIATLDDPSGAKPKPNGRVNGIVFRDGSNDDTQFAEGSISPAPQQPPTDDTMARALKALLE